MDESAANVVGKSGDKNPPPQVRVPASRAVRHDLLTATAFLLVWIMAPLFGARVVIFMMKLADDEFAAIFLAILLLAFVPERLAPGEARFAFLAADRPTVRLFGFELFWWQLGLWLAALLITCLIVFQDGIVAGLRSIPGALIGMFPFAWLLYGKWHSAQELKLIEALSKLPGKGSFSGPESLGNAAILLIASLVIYLLLAAVFANLQGLLPGLGITAAVRAGLVEPLEVLHKTSDGALMSAPAACMGFGVAYWSLQAGLKARVVRLLRAG